MFYFLRTFYLKEIYFLWLFVQLPIAGAKIESGEKRGYIFNFRTNNKVYLTTSITYNSQSVQSVVGINPVLCQLIQSFNRII